MTVPAGVTFTVNDTSVSTAASAASVTRERHRARDGDETVDSLTAGQRGNLHPAIRGYHVERRGRNVERRHLDERDRLSRHAQ